MIYPLTFPNAAPASERLVLNRRQSVGESPWTFKKTITDGATQWVLEWTWPPVSFQRGEALSAWLLSLKGQEGSFRYHPRQSAKSPLFGMSLNITGYAYNDSVSVKGWVANAGTGLRLGQWVSIGNQLFRIIEAAAFADANGNATIVLSPSLRTDFPAGTAVNFATPSGVFSLATSDGLDPSLTPDRHLAYGPITAREVV